jgi:hypothetical protein
MSATAGMLGDTPAVGGAGEPGGGSRAARWWPLAAIMVLAGALRCSTLNLQSLWYDEAFTPVHVLHAGLWATLRSVSHTENTPPLWYVLEWALTRVLGTGAIALRLLSAIAGLATVPVAFAIGRELGGRRAAICTALLVAVNPLFLWYSQEARAYALFVLMVALAMLCFLRALEEPSPGRLTAFALTGSLALLTHYFALFPLIGMIVLLLAGRRLPAGERPVAAGDGLKGRIIACAVIAAVGLALLPLVLAQGGHGAQWIGSWALSSRLEAIPQYYLTGNSGAPLGHGIELLVAMPIVVGVLFGLWRVLERSEERGALLALALAVCGVLLPIGLVAVGEDYLAPRNLIAAMIPLTAAIAVVVTARRTGRGGALLAGLIAVAFLAISIDVDLSPRLQRGDWHGVARALATGSRERVITTVELGSAPLEYYLSPLESLAPGSSVAVREIDETGYSPLRPSAGEPPAPGFSLEQRLDINGLIVYRFISQVPRRVSERVLREHVITLAHPEVLIPVRGRTSS